MRCRSGWHDCPSVLSDRLLEWHNRSTAEEVDERVALLNLAIAFESLLNLESDKVTGRFRETIMTLLGSSPRLDSWVDQFYNARSAVAHKGKTHHLMFYAMDWDKKRIESLNEKDITHVSAM